jgi:hypothetical protein
MLYIWFNHIYVSLIVKQVLQVILISSEIVTCNQPVLVTYCREFHEYVMNLLQFAAI